MLGTTESMFAPRPETLFEEESQEKNNFPPLSVLKMIALQSEKAIGCGDIARNAGPPKMKRPMETNRLDCGPPTKVFSNSVVLSVVPYVVIYVVPCVVPCQGYLVWYLVLCIVWCLVWYIV